MTTINNSDPIYPDYQLGKLTCGTKQVTIGDLMKYAKKKTFGRLWMTITSFFTGKGFITKETAATLLQRHPQRDKILENFNILKTLIKTQTVAQSIIEKKPPAVGQLPIAKTTETKTTEQETPGATPKKKEEQKIENNATLGQREDLKTKISSNSPTSDIPVKHIFKQATETFSGSHPQKSPKIDSSASKPVLNQAQSTTSQKNLPKEIMNPPSSSVKSEEVESTERLKREEPPIPVPRESEKTELPKAAHAELSPKIAVTSNEEMDLNEADRIIREALKIKTSRSPIYELKVRLDSEWLSFVTKMSPNYYLTLLIGKTYEKGNVILEWALQNREFPQLYKAMKPMTSWNNFRSTIDEPDLAEPDKREFFKALHRACLAPVEESNVPFLNIDRDDSSQHYTILKDASNTLSEHNLHKSKYGSALHEFLTRLHGNILQIALRLGIPTNPNPTAQSVLDWALDNEKMPELYNAMKPLTSLGSLRREIEHPEQIEDPKKLFVFTVLNYVCRASAT